MNIKAEKYIKKSMKMNHTREKKSRSLYRTICKKYKNRLGQLGK